MRPSRPSALPRRLLAGLTLTLALCVLSLLGCRHLVHDIEPRGTGDRVRVVVEIPAGTNAKWEVEKSSGRVVWEQRDGRPRVVDYLAYPGSYGMVPRTLLPRAEGGDGDPLDVIVLGPTRARGAVVEVRLIGVLELLDGGERDDKLIAVQPDAPLGDVESIEDLDRRYPGVSEILRTWFTSYKGAGVLEALGFAGPSRAEEILAAAVEAYARTPR